MKPQYSESPNRSTFNVRLATTQVAPAAIPSSRLTFSGFAELSRGSRATVRSESKMSKDLSVQVTSVTSAEQMSMSLPWRGPLPTLPNCGFFWTFRAERLMPGVRRTTDCTQKSWRILVCLHRGIARKHSARPAGSAENLSLQNSVTTLGPIHETGLGRKITIRWVHDAL